MTTRYVTDEELRDAIGDAQIEPDRFGEVLDDARRIHRFVIEEPWLTEAKLRAKAEEEGLGPDRVNIALRVLESTGQLFAVSLTEKQIPESSGQTEEPAEEEAPPSA